MPLAIHFARRSLLGVPPILHWLQKFLLQLRVLKTLSVRTLPTMKRQWFSATWLEVSDNPSRKTKYDLITIWNESLSRGNINSQAPQGSERMVGSSGLCNSPGVLLWQAPDLLSKGCALKVNGVGSFPDEPVERRAVLTGTDSGQQAGVMWGGLCDPGIDHQDVA